VGDAMSFKSMYICGHVHPGRRLIFCVSDDGNHPKLSTHCSRWYNIRLIQQRQGENTQVCPVVVHRQAREKRKPYKGILEFTSGSQWKPPMIGQELGEALCEKLMRELLCRQPPGLSVNDREYPRPLTQLASSSMPMLE